MRITKARYITEDGIKIVTLNEITKKKYDAIFKGQLYCPTENCPAKVSFCSGRTAHYKTWRYSNHSVDCNYHLDRSERRTVIGLNKGITMNISSKHKQEALLRAFKSMVQEEINESINASGKSLNKKNKSPQKESGEKEQSVQLKLTGGDFDEDNSNIRGKRILSRFVHLISPTDLGQVRLIKGLVKNVELLNSVAEIKVSYNNEDIVIVFEERFIKEPLNSSYLNKFWVIKELLNTQKEIVFHGVGEVRTDKEGNYELSVSSGPDIKLNGEDIYNIARRMNTKII